MDILKDLADVCAVEYATVNKLVDKAENICCDYAVELTNNYDNVAEINIGIGTLYIKFETDVVKYKFVPSNRFENKINDAFKNKSNSLEKSIEKSLITKLHNAYKELF